MTGFDYAVLIIVGFSVLLSVLRGGVSEIISLTAWILAFWLAQHYTPDVARYLPADVPGPEVRLIAAFIGIFLGVWFISALLRITVSQFIKAVGLGLADRMIGAVFGVARGCIIVLAIVMVCSMTSLPKQPIWRNAMFSAPFEAAAISIKPWLPQGLAQYMKYE